MTPFVSRVALVGVLFLTAAGAGAQAPAETAARHVGANAAALGLEAADVADLVVADQHVSRVSGATHVYFQQAVDGVPVYNALVNVTVGRDGAVVSAASRAVRGLRGAIGGSARSLTPEAALAAAGRALGVPVDLRAREALAGPGERYAFENASTADRVTAELMYVPADRGGVHLAWVATLATPDGSHLWQAAIDAGSGALLRRDDLADEDHWAVDDHLPEGWAVVAEDRAAAVEAAPFAEVARLTGAPTSLYAAPGQYRVYGGNVESPSHAGDPYADLRTLETTAGYAPASPQGWHSTGSTSYTITRGNNVWAGLDGALPNGIDFGSEPDGGAGLVFDFVFDPATQPAADYQPAAITNLFYWNNVVHDVAWVYGFDEAAGNFQATNFTGAGAGGDAVNAEAQDFSGTNNANFATPSDGSAPRMQMYVWTSSLVNELAFDDQTAAMSGAAFGLGYPEIGVTAAAALVDDGTELPNEGCNTLTNPLEILGKIAVAYRGGCGFTVKAFNAQAAGAVGIVVINNVPGDPITLGGDDPTVLIPAGMISDVDGAALVAALPTTVTGRNLGASAINRDSDFDAGVIAHEYGHGISNRLTGGRTNTGCLGNQEQMGEGWSDYYALLLTDTNTDGRGVGTYLTYEPTTGAGIRPYRYSVDFGVNPATYDYVKTAAVPHGVGFVWATMTWDMTRMLVDRYGWSPDLYAGAGGNNVSLQLVTEGMKIQPCSPGFVDGRDAILAADVAIHGGANQCLIWDAFSRRGLGLSADQGASTSVTDGTEAFDLPIACATSQMGLDAIEDNETMRAPQKGRLRRDMTRAGRRYDQGKPNHALYHLDRFDETVSLIPERWLSPADAAGLLEYSAGLRNRVLEAFPAAFAEFDADFADAEAGAPAEYALEQSAPNPTSGRAAIPFALPEAGPVRIVVFDVTGRQVATVADGEFAAGVHTASLDASGLAAGTYVYRIEAGDFVATKRLTVVR